MDFQHEIVIPNDGFPFKLFLFEGYNGNYKREKHWHTSIEIFSVLEGSLSLFLNETEYSLGAGELIIVNSNEIHSIHAPKKNQTVVLQIPLKQFEGYFTARQFIRFKSAARRNRDQTSPVPDNRKLAFFVEELYKVYQEKGVGCEYRILALYYNILFLLVRDYRESEAAENEIASSRQLEALSKITSYMRENYKEKLTLKDTAARFGYSNAYLSRMFKQCTGMNFMEYLKDIRMAYAYRELMNTRHTLGQIALGNGFNSSRALTTEFIARYGCPPSVYRMQARKAAQESRNQEE